MATPRKSRLKAYRATIGFDDAFVAAPSQKAALAAWDTDKDLFARGTAEMVAPADAPAEVFSEPGRVFRRSRGDLADQLRALGPDRPRPRPAPARPSPRVKTEPKSKPKPKPTPKPKPKPKPSRAALDAAERALSQAARRAAAELAALDKRSVALERERQTAIARRDKTAAKLERNLKRERERYVARVDAWRV